MSQKCPQTCFLTHLIPRTFFSLTKIICNRNFGNECASTHSKDYLYYLDRSTLSQIFDNATSPQNGVYTGIFLCGKPTLCQRKLVYGNQALLLNACLCLLGRCDTQGETHYRRSLCVMQSSTKATVITKNSYGRLLSYKMWLMNVAYKLCRRVNMAKIKCKCTRAPLG